jgi:DNA-directed RNA polymerase, omega subunit
MLHPSYSEIIDAVNSEVEPGEQPVVQSRYSIVIATAKRARQLIAGEVAEVPDYKKKPLSVAIEELHKGKVKIVSEDETENIEDTQAKQEQEEE